MWGLALSLVAVALSALITAIFYTAPRVQGLILMVSNYFPVSEAVFSLAAIAGMFALMVHKQLDREGLAFRESAARWGRIIGYSVLILYAVVVVAQTVIVLLVLLYMLVLQPLFQWPPLTM